MLHHLGLSLRIALVGVGMLLSSTVSATGAQAAESNLPNLRLYDLGACQADRVGFTCIRDSAASTQTVTAQPVTAGTNAPLLAQHAYILCWTTGTGQSLPIGTDCAEPSRVVSVPSQVPAEVTASGCTLYPHLGWTLVRTSASGEPCTVRITTPDAGALVGTTTEYQFPFALGGIAIDGEVRASLTGSGRVGQSLVLQSPLCPASIARSGPMLSCPQVTLDWAVLQGTRSCRIVVQDQLMRGGQVRLDYGRVSVRFLRPGTCQVQGTYPEQPGRTAAYQTGAYRFTVRR